MNSYLINGAQLRENKNEEKINDPRWDALKKLRNKDK